MWLRLNRRVSWGTLFAAAALLSAACASEAPPPGGPADLEPPTVLITDPEGGAIGVPRRSAISVTFSERMDKRSTEREIKISPGIRWTRTSWKGTTITLVPAESLAADQAYVVGIGGGARDRRNNAMMTPVSFAFTTGDSLPAGSLRGKVDPARSGGLVQVYALPAEEGGRPPRVIDPSRAACVAQPDTGGVFLMEYLSPERGHWLVAFSDRNRNGVFDQDPAEPWGWHPAVLLPESGGARTTAEVRLFDPAREGLVLGRVRGTEGRPAAMLLAVSTADSVRPRVEEPQGADGAFLFPLPEGKYRLGVFRDANGNGLWDEEKIIEGGSPDAAAGETVERDSLVVVDESDSPARGTEESVVPGEEISWYREAVTVTIGEETQLGEWSAPPADTTRPDSGILPKEKP